MITVDKEADLVASSIVLFVDTIRTAGAKVSDSVEVSHRFWAMPIEIDAFPYFISPPTILYHRPKPPQPQLWTDVFYSSLFSLTRYRQT